MTDNRVWIEIEFPDSDHCRAHGMDRDTLANDRAAKATNLLHRLGAHKHTRIWWHSDHERYCLTLDDAGSYTELKDSGHWFNLDYFGKLD